MKFIQYDNTVYFACQYFWRALPKAYSTSRKGQTEASQLRSVILNEVKNQVDRYSVWG
jgi:hypothetical protein